MDTIKLTELDRVEMGLDLAAKLNRLEDSELRVLIFTAAYFVLDGVSLTIRRLESHLRSHGAIVKVLTTVPDNVDAEQLADVIAVPGIKIPFNHAGDYSFGVGLDETTIEQIEQFKPNVVHFTVPDFVALDGIRWCQKNNVAYIGTWHSNYIEYLKYYFIEWILGPGMSRYLKGFFEQMPTVYAPTSYMLRKMRDEWGYGSATELKLWGRGVDMNIFNPERRSQQFRASKDVGINDVAILWVGRIVPEKRPDIWLSVVRRLQDEGHPVKALVVGSGTFEKYLSQLKHVKCCGWLSGTALGEAYASADILVFPSDVETFGNVTLEALSSGCPSIVEKKCGEHLVDHGVNGLTCQSGDSEGFYQAARMLVMDFKLRQQMSEAAREKAKKFERNIILQQMAENYKDAIEKHRDPAFLKKHLQNPEGAGRNILSVLCCNYFLVKLIAEPFLNTSRGVQDLVDNTSECVQRISTSRLSCSDLLVHATSSQASIQQVKEDSAKDVYDEEGQLERYDESKDESKKRRKHWTSRLLPCLPTLFSSSTSNSTARAVVPVASVLTRSMYYFALLISIVIALLFIYAVFTVR